MINIYNNNQWQDLGTFAERVTSYPVTSTNSFNGDFPTTPASEYTSLIIKNVGSSDINDIVSPIATEWTLAPDTGFKYDSSGYYWKIVNTYATKYLLIPANTRPLSYTLYTNKMATPSAPMSWSYAVTTDTGSYPNGNKVSRSTAIPVSTGVNTPYKYYFTWTPSTQTSSSDRVAIFGNIPTAMVSSDISIRRGDKVNNPNAKSITISVTNGGTTTTYPITLDSPLTPNSTITRNINTPTGTTTITVDNPNVIVYVPFDGWINSLNTIHVYNNGSWQ